MPPRGRAALIALALGLGLLDGLPLLPPERAAALPPFLQAANARAVAAQALLLAPFRPFLSGLVVSERWSLFAGASRDRFRFELAARREPSGPWVLLYRADDARHRLFAEVIEYRRVRGAWNPRTEEPPPGYEAFGSFIAERVFAARPEFGAVRLRMERIRIQERGGYARSGAFVHELTRERGPERGAEPRARP